GRNVGDILRYWWLHLSGSCSHDSCRMVWSSEDETVQTRMATTTPATPQNLRELEGCKGQGQIQYRSNIHLQGPVSSFRTAASCLIARCTSSIVVRPVYSEKSDPEHV